MSYILVVDDEKDIRDLISQILFEEGHTVKLAQNSTSAIDYINNEEPVLIILDIWLKDSEMDGIEILKSVRQNNPLCPVVVISGHGNIEIAVAAVKQGAYDFIEKPFNIDQLLLVINRALETSRLRKEVFSLQNKEINESKMVGGTGAFKILRQKLLILHGCINQITFLLMCFQYLIISFFCEVQTFPFQHDLPFLTHFHQTY